MKIQSTLKLKNILIEKLKKKGINNSDILDAILNLDRENFIPKAFSNVAYEDNALPIAENQTISQPYTVAFMTSLLDVKPEQKILEIGTGSGYQAAILEKLGAEVYTIERIKKLHESSNIIFKKLNININSKLDDGTKGWIQKAPFDSIIITAATPKIDDILLNQLNNEGKLLAPIGDKQSQTMTLFTLINGKIIKKEFGNFKFVPLIGKNGFDG
ncbi:protein-L-isoaspartate(D-aspartate) O-methyltransferase [Candidatus Kapabacteria bacterium]|nr:protein-L-isoaspartate(D-aspartate) O-methyltransferase [Candidatus Kapabacteria bacterium]